MPKKLLITEKPSVAMEFSKALKQKVVRRNGYLESEDWIITWCVGHLVTMSYPEVYDENLKKWTLDTLPFMPEKYLYEVIPASKKQYDIVICDAYMEYPNKKVEVTSGIEKDLLSKKEIKENFIKFYPSAWNKIYKRTLSNTITNVV